MGEEKIVVLGTGGTIAGVAQAGAGSLDYRAAQWGIEQLLAAVPGLRETAGCSVQSEQIAQLDSKDMDLDTWRRLALRCAALLADPQVRGLVITHGTDTLEETAWFLHQVLAAHKPVVLTCAMRPATAPFPDGPQNLLDAVAVARTPGACGVVAVVAGVIHEAQWVKKVHPYRLDAFSSEDVGPLGWVEEGAVRLIRKWPQTKANQAQAAIEKINRCSTWPRVELVFSHAGASGAIVDALVQGGVQGLVVAATGNGTVHAALEEALLRAQAAGVRVLRATRCSEGQLLPRPGDVLPAAPGLSPVKARITLLLDLLP
ncbi:asparaginase [Extensimonas vulgaris]|uniref:L-asparaginase n=1 Tax=Extensimonas vulgaris TaxID=1031594 RepID=A0A369AL37_9BURK|nr:asparaginase [Extensimonas vulgaris]RCX08996.1 L-asparaginase [Extensimonas vulgaris]TWI37232.1 L-asparaginase [Extensimonas vulgaris]